jgi:hypothetical protein
LPAPPPPGGPSTAIAATSRSPTTSSSRGRSRASIVPTASGGWAREDGEVVTGFEVSHAVRRRRHRLLDHRWEMAIPGVGRMTSAELVEVTRHRPPRTGPAFKRQPQSAAIACSARSEGPAFPHTHRARVRDPVDGDGDAVAVHSRHRGASGRPPRRACWPGRPSCPRCGAGPGAACHVRARRSVRGPRGPGLPECG